MNGTRSIRPLRTEDLPVVARLTTEVRRTTYLPWIPTEEVAAFMRQKTLEKTTEKLSAYLQQEGVIGFVCVYNDQIDGYILGNDRQEVISYLFIRQEAQGHGIGSALFDTFLGRNQLPYVIEVLEKNTKAIAMYERHGFSKIDRPVQHYFGLHKIAMRRQINSLGS